MLINSQHLSLISPHKTGSSNWNIIVVPEVSNNTVNI